ncbi:MAG: hypothetical protein ACI8Q6_001854 [Granulosicoccus sp.]|jgi:hypothetical protein
MSPPHPEFTHTVHVNCPVDGGHKEQTFKAKFKVASDDEAEGVRFHEVDAVKTYLRTIVVSMDELADDQDKPVTYNDEVREQMLALADGIILAPAPCSVF